MTSMRCASLAVVALLALQGCGGDDKGTCEKASYNDKKDNKKHELEMCCKDNKPVGSGELAPTPDSCKEKDEAKMKASLKDQVSKLAKKKGEEPAPAPNKNTEPTENASELEVAADGKATRTISRKEPK